MAPALAPDYPWKHRIEALGALRIGLGTLILVDGWEKAGGCLVANSVSSRTLKIFPPRRRPSHPRCGTLQRWAERSRVDPSLLPLGASLLTDRKGRAAVARSQRGFLVPAELLNLTSVRVSVSTPTIDTQGLGRLNRRYRYAGAADYQGARSIQHAFSEVSPCG